MIRREDELTAELRPNSAGIPIRRNPGVSLVWITKTFKVFNAGNGPMIEIGEPLEMIWYANGRIAAREEVAHSVDTGLPLLAGMIQHEPEWRQPAAQRDLERRHAWLVSRYPKGAA